MLSISPGASPPASPMDEMCTNPKSRVRDWGTTPWRKLPKVCAPASPAETAVVTAVMWTSSSAGSPMPRCGQRWVCRSTRPGVTSLPPASIRCTARSAGMSGAIAAIWPYLIPMSRLPRRFWLGSSTSPPAMTSSYLSAGSPGLKPIGIGCPACATSTGAASAADAPATPPATAALVESLMKSRRDTSIFAPSPLRHPAPHGGRLARQLELLAGVRDLGALHLEDGDVPIRVVADVEVLAVVAEDHALGQAAHLDLAHLGHLLALDLEDGETPVALGVEPHGLGHAGAAEQHGDRHVALRADGEAFRRIADHHAVDDPGRRALQVDDADGVDVSVRGAGVAVVRADADLAVRRDADVVRPESDRHVVLGVGHLLPVDLEQGDLVGRELGRERALAVGRA